MLAGGGEACADIEHLRSQADLFGSVPSDSTLYRTFRHIDADDAGRAVGRDGRGARRGVAAVGGDDRHRHGRVGHRRVVASDPLGEQAGHRRELQGRLRVPSDLLLRRRHRRDAGGAVAARQRRRPTTSPITSPCSTRRSPSCPTRSPSVTAPATIPRLVRRAVQVRTDSAGCTDFVSHCRDRNVGFAVVARSNASIHAAISRVRFDDSRWQPALRQDGDERPGAAVAELTDLVDLTDWPDGTRLIVRREPLHPGANARMSRAPWDLDCGTGVDSAPASIGSGRPAWRWRRSKVRSVDQARRPESARGSVGDSGPWFRKSASTSGRG